MIIPLPGTGIDPGTGTETVCQEPLQNNPLAHIMGLWLYI